MKPWIPIVVSTVAVGGIAAWSTLADFSARGAFADGIDPGEVACTELVSGDLLLLMQDDYYAWGQDVYSVARTAAESEVYGVGTAADVIVDLFATNGEFIPIELNSMTDDLADACVTAGFISDEQVSDARLQ